MKTRQGDARERSEQREQAETLAIAALSFLAGDPERLGAFLALSGIGPESIRAAATEPRFLAGILDHVVADERLLLAFAAEAGIDPADLGRAQMALAGGQSEVS
jgi:hypothetical protein